MAFIFCLLIIYTLDNCLLCFFFNKTDAYNKRTSACWRIRVSHIDEKRYSLPHLGLMLFSKWQSSASALNARVRASRWRYMLQPMKVENVWRERVALPRDFRLARQRGREQIQQCVSGFVGGPVRVRHRLGQMCDRPFLRSSKFKLWLWIKELEHESIDCRRQKWREHLRGLLLLLLLWLEMGIPCWFVAQLTLRVHCMLREQGKPEVHNQIEMKLT